MENNSNNNRFMLNLGLYSVMVQKYFWVVGVPYIILSPFIWGNFYRQPPPPPAQIMPVLLVDSLGNSKKISCNQKEEEFLPLAKKQALQLTAAFMSWPQSKPQSSARMASFSKYFTQEKSSSAQSFLAIQSTKILTEAQFSQAAYEVTGIAAEFDSDKNEYVVVLDGVQTILKNEAKTSQKMSLDITFKKANENRKKYEDIILEITSVKVRKNENI